MTSGVENQNNTTQQEVCLLDILCFLKSTWKVLIISGLIGVSFSIVYLFLTPKQYEATAQITMAQIGVSNNNNNNNPKLLGVNIEEPALLIARLSSPMSFTPQVFEACNPQNQANAALILSKSIKLTIPKGVANVVELKTYGPTPQIAKECALAVFGIIKFTQSQIIAPYIEQAKAKIVEDKISLQKARDLLAKADKSEVLIGAAYLSTRDEIRYLLDEINSLQNMIIFTQIYTTRHLAPIYAGEMPISPKKSVALFIGFFSGLLLGLLISLARKVFVSFRQRPKTQGEVV